MPSLANIASGTIIRTIVPDASIQGLQPIIPEVPLSVSTTRSNHVHPACRQPLRPFQASFLANRFHTACLRAARMIMTLCRHMLYLAWSSDPNVRDQRVDLDRVDSLVS